MDAGQAFPAQAQAAEEVQPGEGALDDPAQRAEAGAVLGAAPGDDRLDGDEARRGGRRASRCGLLLEVEMPGEQRFLLVGGEGEFGFTPAFTPSP